jgi:hypothetical protein
MHIFVCFARFGYRLEVNLKETVLSMTMLNWTATGVIILL